GVAAAPGDAVTPSGGRISVGLGYTGLQRGELQYVASVERRALNRLAHHAAPDRFTDGLDVRCLAGHFDRFAGLADQQPGVQPERLVDLQFLVCEDLPAETGGFHNN